MRHFVTISLFLVALSACSPRVVEVERPVIVERTRTQTRTDIVRDTLVRHDSVYHYVQGDTVIIERWHQTVNVNRVVVTDTVRDTVPLVTEVRVPVEVEKPLSRWQRVRMEAGGWAISLAAAAALGGLGWLAWRRRR